jgi:hypothetical protein
MGMGSLGITGDMRISGCSMILALRIRCVRGGGRYLGRRKRRRVIGLRRGGKREGRVVVEELDVRNMEMNVETKNLFHDATMSAYMSAASNYMSVLFVC